MKNLKWYGEKRIRIKQKFLKWKKKYFGKRVSIAFFYIIAVTACAVNPQKKQETDFILNDWYQEGDSLDMPQASEVQGKEILQKIWDSMQKDTPFLFYRLEDGEVQGFYKDCWKADNAVFLSNQLKDTSLTFLSSPVSVDLDNQIGLEMEEDWGLWACPDGKLLIKNTEYICFFQSDKVYSILREWCDELEFKELNGTYDCQNIIIPNRGQSYLEAAAEYCQAFESIHLSASKGSKFCYTFVQTEVMDALETTQLMQKNGEIGENGYCFYLVTVFVPENSAAFNWSMAGNTREYTGEGKDIPEGAFTYSRCGYITLEEDGWHGKLVGTGW